MIIRTQGTSETFLSRVWEYDALRRRKGRVQSLVLSPERDPVQLKADIVTSAISTERPVEANAYGFLSDVVDEPFVRPLLRAICSLNLNSIT